MKDCIYQAAASQSVRRRLRIRQIASVRVNMPLTASDCKARMKKLLYTKNYAGAIEEVVNVWNADIVAAKWNGEVNEFEIKVALSDLRGEIKAIRRALQGGIYKNEVHQTRFWSYNRVEVEEKVSLTKLEKHYCYLVGDKQGQMSFNGVDGIDPDNPKPCFVPHKFYFAVPTELVEKAKELLKDVPSYGILDVETGEFAKSARTLKRANVRFTDIFSMFTRACTELHQAESTSEYYRNIYEKGEYVHVKKKHVWQDYKGNARVDWV